MPNVEKTRCGQTYYADYGKNHEYSLVGTANMHITPSMANLFLG